MALQVVGAGLGRTGTHSLKVAFEQLLGGPCYHMVEVFGRPDQRDTWAAAVPRRGGGLGGLPGSLLRHGGLAGGGLLARAE